MKLRKKSIKNNDAKKIAIKIIRTKFDIKIK